LIEAWAFRFRAGNNIGVFVRNFISALFGHFAEVKQLSFEMLVAS
jgi:hypothetical protein